MFSKGSFMLCPDQTKSKSAFKFMLKNELCMSRLVRENRANLTSSGVKPVFESLFFPNCN